MNHRCAHSLLRLAALLTLVFSGCTTEKPPPRVEPVSPQPSTPPPIPITYPVMLGIDVLADQGFGILAGKRVGLLTHDAATNREGEPTWSVLFRSPRVNLVALFAAEHGIENKAPASAVIEDHTHRPTGLPVYSLYGTARRPTVRLLKQFDVLVIDLQDIGTRSYTFASAMREALEASVRAGVDVVVLDRPNPLGGEKVDGPMIDPEWRGYVGAFPVPYVHGLTIGELARLALETEGVLDIDDAARRAARLTIVPMRGWRRSMRWKDTGLTWRPTSPYIQDLESVEGYPITGLGCILGGWTHGIGKEHPFRGLAFPGKTADEVVAALEALHVPGLGFRRVDVLNEAGKKAQGVSVDISDWRALHPTELSFHLMRLACAWNARNPFRGATTVEKQVFNRHVGSTAWWNALVRDGASVNLAAFLERWRAEDRAFREASRAYWLYPDNPAP